MTIIESDVYDETFMKLDEAKQTDALKNGNARFASLCLKHGIVNASIATPAPYIPYRIGIVCVLISAFTSMIGTDWREVGNGQQIDTYKVKVDALEKELKELLSSFTTTMCGYDDEDDSDETSSSSIRFYRG